MTVPALETNDVRALLRLLGELRELGADPAAWRSHLAQQLESLLEARVSLIAEFAVPTEPPGSTNCADVVTVLQAADFGLDAGVRDPFYREVCFTDHETDDALQRIVPLYGSTFTIARADVVADRQWDRSNIANQHYRAHGCDDFVFSMAPVASFGVISTIAMYSGARQRFGAREKLFIELLHEELARDFRRSERQQPRLTPRQRQVMERLVAGASEKELAYEFQVSAHTAHDHVKALYRAFGSHSRGEFLAAVQKRNAAPRAHLFAEL
ncbi:MAG TPA: LuxR C-terminal-related transcriptional regulator [Polyangiales bacterium]|nr:LuxR C-terminal-related transcriptional regulator [Polyangiales bacterium]